MAVAAAMLGEAPLTQAALAEAWTSDHSEPGSAKREEARLMLIALLGYVLAAYRLYVGSDSLLRSAT